LHILFDLVLHLRFSVVPQNEKRGSGEPSRENHERKKQFGAQAQVALPLAVFWVTGAGSFVPPGWYCGSMESGDIPEQNTCWELPTATRLADSYV
jgi:hypothetical protein